VDLWKIFLPLFPEKMKTLRLILTFYKSYAFTSLLITFISLGIVYSYGDKAVEIIQVLIWFKIFTLAIIVFYIQKYKRQQFYYYKNLGLSRLTLWFSSLSFDLLLFLIAIITLAIKLHETHP